jgi:exonuclease VII large subunit
MTDDRALTPFEALAKLLRSRNVVLVLTEQQHAELLGALDAERERTQARSDALAEQLAILGKPPQGSA